MFKTIDNFIRKQYRIDSEDEMRRFYMLSFFSIAGLLLAITMLVLDLILSKYKDSIPGDITLFMVVSLYS